MAVVRQFEVVEEPESPPPMPLPAPQVPPQKRADPEDSAAAGVIMLALKALSQRALVAIESMFTLITVFSAFVLWYKIPTPNEHQIVALALYAVFVLAANWIVRRK